MTAAKQMHPTHFPDDDIPIDSVVDGELPLPPIDEAFDYVVVGSGAAGAVAAHHLAEGGFSVALVEEGPWIKTRDFGDQVYPALSRMFRDAGTQMLEGDSFIPLIQGRCVGGSTVVNSAIAWRIPEEVLEDWATRFGTGDVLTARTLEPHYERLEAALHVNPVSNLALGNNNRLFLEGGKRLGMHPARMKRYDHGCQGSGRCMTGCPTAAKQGMNVTYVPWALKRGARLFSSCRVDHIEIALGRARRVIAKTQFGTHVSLRARRAVLVAASTVQTPGILRRSRIRSPFLGENFQAHPGVGVAGVFDSKVHLEFGATQGAEITELRRTERIKLETISLQPELAAVRFPGVGRAFMQKLGAYGHIAGFACVVRAESVGRVTTTWGGRDRVVMRLSKVDMARARKGAVLLCKILFEAGARSVWPGISGMPSVLNSIDEVRALEEAPLDSRAYTMIASHLFGAARMGASPDAGVVGLDFGVHGVKGLHVLDSSVFPTNIGVNPQHTIMAVSRLAASRLLEMKAR